MMLLAVMTLSFAAPLQVDAAPACPAQPAPLPAELGGWSRMTPLAGGADVAGAAQLPLGGGARATLVATPALRPARTPPKADAPDTFGGLFSVTIAVAGRYRVALGGAAWVDVLSGSRSLTSVAHGHGPACSPIRKTVDFDLAPGRYLLQLTGSKTAILPLIVAPVPAAAPPHTDGHGAAAPQG